MLLYTGLRRGDTVRFGRQHIRNGIGTIKTEKTNTAVTLPILPVLMKTLDAGPCGDLTFIAGESGRPLTKKSFGNLFRKACREAGLQNRSVVYASRRLLALQRTAPQSRSSMRSSAGRE